MLFAGIILILLSESFASEESNHNLFRVCFDLGVVCVSKNHTGLISLLKETNYTSVEIIFTESYTLNGAFYFEHLSPSLLSLDIRGNTPDTVLKCVPKEEGAGFLFRGVQNIGLNNITIEECGFCRTLINGSVCSAIFIEECTNVTLTNIEVRRSSGTGVVLLNNMGNTSVSDCRFENNSLTETQTKNCLGGNGVLLILTDATNSSVLFTNSQFQHNRVNATNLHPNIYTGVGGGMQVSIIDKSKGNNVRVNCCLFKDNAAVWGGGMDIVFHGDTKDNTLSLTSTNITDNKSNNKGGGGADIGFLSNYNNRNLVIFDHCLFEKNSAESFGGGTSIYGVRNFDFSPQNNSIKFYNCRWIENTAIGGSAVDISPSINQFLSAGIYPVPLFVDCTFEFNYIRTHESHLNDRVIHYRSGVGAFLITILDVQFQGETIFDSNNGSSLFLGSATVVISNGSCVMFRNNEGIRGGAVSVNSLSAIIIHDDSVFEFVNNSATLMGGALYVYSSDPHEYLTPRNCFIQYPGTTMEIKQRNIEFIFDGNRALSNVGNDVYALSVQACTCNGSLMIFNCLGNSSSMVDMKTGINEFVIDNSTNDSILSSIVPGHTFYPIPLTALDETGIEIKHISYEVIQNQNNNNGNLRPLTNFTSQNGLQFNGSNNASRSLSLGIQGSTLTFSIHSSLLCPPGYQNRDNSMCECATERLFGASHCNATGAYLTNGFWLGNCQDGSVCSSHCPLGFCAYDDNKINLHILPKRYEDLEQFMCGKSRSGVLCGQCSTNYSVYYHSYSYRCGKNTELCKYGWIFYIISELIPVTVMFLIIVIFDICFNSGGINGFIFFAQVIDSLSIDANGVINAPPSIQVLINIHRFIYRVFNFDFFSLEDLSFCMWERATVLDIMVIKYLTIVSAIIFMLIVITLMNTTKCKQFFSCCLRPRTLRSSAVHGLTAFIVVCYSQCARISFQILGVGTLYGLDYEKADLVVFRSGVHGLFSPMHLKYAIPALAILVIMSFLPFLLILYPLVFKILAVCNLSESRFANVISRIIPIPLLDTFQSSFKDNCRFFAGFYFIYRLFALLSYTYSYTLLFFYTVVELQLIVMLAVHAAAQPYKLRWHNIVDSLIFMNLALINGITIFNYQRVLDGKNLNNVKGNYTYIALSFQTLLIYLPLVYIVLYFSVILFRKCKDRLTMTMPSDTSLINSVELPPLRDDSGPDVDALAKKKERLLAEYTYGY